MANAFLCDGCNKLIDPVDGVKFMVTLSTTGGTIYHVHCDPDCASKVMKLIEDARDEYRRDEADAVKFQIPIADVPAYRASRAAEVEQNAEIAATQAAEDAEQKKDLEAAEKKNRRRGSKQTKES